MIEEEGTLAIVIVIGLLVMFGMFAVIATSIVYDRKPEVIKCIDACGNILQAGEEGRMIALPLKEVCAEKCMDMRDVQQPIIYKAECTCNNGNNYLPNYWDIYHNVSFNLTPGWVYTDDGGNVWRTK